MTIKELKEIFQNLPEDAIVLLSAEDIYDIETVIIEKHRDGRVHLILSSDE